MRISVEMMLETIMIAAGCVLMAGMISCNVAVLQARSYFYQVSDRIEYSQNDEAVINSVIQEAGKKGYRLKAKKLSEDDENSCYLLEMHYPMQIPVFSKHGEAAAEEGVIQGYAR